MSWAQRVLDAIKAEGKALKIDTREGAFRFIVGAVIVLGLGFGFGTPAASVIGLIIAAPLFIVWRIFKPKVEPAVDYDFNDERRSTLAQYLKQNFGLAPFWWTVEGFRLRHQV